VRKIGGHVGRRGALVVLVMLLIVLGVASGAGAGDTQEKLPASDSLNPPVRELPGRRTVNSKTYELAKGGLETRLFGTAINYRDDDGDWQPIDQRLRETSTGVIANGKNRFDVHLAQDLDEAPVKVTIGKQWVSETLLEVNTEPVEVKKGGVVSYSAHNGAVDFEFMGLANGFKETIRLASSSAPLTYYFRLEASPGVVPALEKDGSIAFRGGDGNLVAEMPAPFMVDKAQAIAPVNAIKYNIQAMPNGSWKLAIEADSQWLQASERSWPVIIDPSVTIPSPSRDCIIATTTDNPMCGNFGYGYLTSKANYPSAGQDSFARTLLSFDLSPIPKTASLTSATIGLYSAKAANNVTRVDLYDISRRWSASYVTWTKAQSLVNWVSAGGDFGKELPAPVSVSTAERGSQQGWWNFSSRALVNLVESWRSSEGGNPGGFTNHGVLLKLADETPRTCCFERRVEWESSAGINKPYLSVQYISPAIADSKVTSPADGTKTAKRLLLTSAWDHSGVEGVTFQYKSGHMWSDIPSGQVIDKNNQVVSWPYEVSIEDRKNEPLYWDVSGLAGPKGTAKVKLRAVLSGSPGASGYTNPVEAELDQNGGGSKDAVAPVGPGTVDLLTGNFTVSRTDVSIPGFESSLQFSHSISSRETSSDESGVLGQGWRAGAPVEEAGGSAWRSLKIESTTEEFEGEPFTYRWANLLGIEGQSLSFEVGESGAFITPPEMTGNVLYRLSESQIAFTDPDGNRTVFSNFGSGSEYWPISVSQTGGAGNKTRMIYDIEGNKRRLKRVIAPAADGITCSDEAATTTTGCRVLSFHYENAKKWGAPESMGWRLAKMTFYAYGQGGPWDVASYSYNSEGRLTAVWDPRISPALQETYTYETDGQLKTLTPAGQEPWTMTYGTVSGEVTGGRLMSVKRPSLIESTPTAQITMAYRVPVSGSAAPYDMSPQAVAAWGQEDVPTDATAIFPPDEVPSNSPSSYAGATVYYMDAEGQASNIASSVGAGSSAPAITTTETDIFGNVVRELTAQNRLRALAAGPGSAAKSRELDTQFRYSADGSQFQEERGPLHAIRLESGAEAGTVIQARSYRSIQYDKGAPQPAIGEPWPHLPTHETTGALMGGKVLDQQTVEYKYNWILRQQIESILDPEGVAIRSTTKYDDVTSLPVEIRQPKDAENVGAGTTKIIYYEKKSSSGSSECEKIIYAGLPCKVEPAVQPASGPSLPITRFASYSPLGKPTEIVEEAGGSAPASRKTLITYDSAGRQTSKQIIGGGSGIPKVETLYSPSNGLATTQQFACASSEPNCDTQATITTVDTLGRVIEYRDADGSKASTTYDLNGRPVSVSDGKGTQTVRYDTSTGLPVELTDSMAGTFTASYDADGQVVKRGLPNGLTAEATFDAAGSAVGLTYTKASNCGTSCAWLSFEVSRSATGRVLAESGTFGTNRYRYDSVGRLVKAEEIPQGAGCRSRTYGYDKNSNRTVVTTRPPVFGGICYESGGSSQNSSYDAADRLLASGLVYDGLGRITSLPGAYAGGSTLETSYFSNDMVASQTQGGISNAFMLDSTLRQRQRVQTGGLEGVEVFHYADGSDSPAWTQLGEAWTRSITGIGGELVALAWNDSPTRLQLTNLHGDVVATASLDPSVSQLVLVPRIDEFGRPINGTPSRFAWLGGAQRRTELPSGVIQMGARSYVPSIGRFLSRDPIAGGSANAYDYGNADPINQLDLTGLKPHDNDCDRGIVGCQCVLHIKMWSPRGGRMGVRMSYQCNRFGGIRRYSFDIFYSADWKTGNGFEPIPPPHYINHYAGPNPACKNYMPCINRQDHSGTFSCVPGIEYQIGINFNYRYNYGVDQTEMQHLSVKAQEFCIY